MRQVNLRGGPIFASWILDFLSGKLSNCKTTRAMKLIFSLFEPLNRKLKNVGIISDILILSKKLHRPPPKKKIKNVNFLVKNVLRK